MKHSFAFAFITTLVCCLTTVDAHHRGDSWFHPQFGEKGSMRSVNFEIFRKDVVFRLLRLCSSWEQTRYRWRPNFPKNTSNKSMNELCKSVKNENLTKAEIEQQLDQWAQNQGEEFHEQFKKSLEREKQKWYNIHQKVKELIANVSQFIGEAEEIQSDMELTRREEDEKLSDLVKRTDWDVRALYKKIRAQDGSLFGQYKQGPCSGCGRNFPHALSPFQHERPNSYLGVRREARQFRSGYGGPFTGDSFLGRDRLFAEKGPYGLNGNLA